MPSELLLEIGTEEIPSDYLEKGLKALEALTAEALKNNRIEISEGLYTHGTPRRLVLMGKAIAEKQNDIIQEVTGPPKAAALDEKGKPTKAALGFAKKQGVSFDDLQWMETSKGEYLYVKRQIPGNPTIEALAEMLPKIIGDLPWPKSMRWGKVGFSFVRPIHWVLALFNGTVVPFDVAGVKSGNLTRGHRFMSPQSIEIKGIQDYEEKIRAAFVIIDREEREKRVVETTIEAASTVSGLPMKDPDLVSTVANLVEFPSAVCGSFDKDFLKIPEPVLITAMKEHQKYFSLRDKEDRLIPHFVAVNNTVPKNESVVRKGHERVLRARLADADFFFKEDRKRPLEDRLDDLKGVIYQADLGTSFEKVQRFTRLAEYLAEQVAPKKLENIRLAARLSKCDLVTEMVMEFPSLQGVMGREYARLDGYPEEVCQAIQEHYLPMRSGDEPPGSVTGAIVSVADRIDTITGCFAVHLEPTGTADPFALRRHALAIIRIIENMAWEISLRELVSKAVTILHEAIEFDEDRLLNKEIDFFRERYKNMMLGAGHTSDLVEAILSAGFDRIHELRFRIDQLKRFMTESSEFESLVLTSKRITNILKNQGEIQNVNPDLFKEPSEFRLWESYEALKGDVLRFIKGKKYYEALDLMVRLRKPVDDLFDEVEILTKDQPQLKDNRVGMLQTLALLFQNLADFSKFAI
jgi:glycyl-tRNA synthetase beta chain